MIKVLCVLIDDRFSASLDSEFLKAGMTRTGAGQYEGSGDTFNTSYFAIKRIFKNTELLSNIKTFTRTIDDEEEDLLKFYDYLNSRGRI